MSTSSITTATTQYVDAGPVRFAYRRLNEGQGTPVVFTQHFMGNLETFDPAVVDGLAKTRDVIIFDNVGKGD